MLQNQIIALIRTYVPIGVGLLLTFLAEHFNIGISDHASAGVSALAVAVVSAGYYGLARLLEHRWPQLGVLLGVPAKPAYPVIGKPAAKDAGSAELMLLIVILVFVLIIVFHGKIT